MEKSPIRLAIVGIGNCASALLQGLYYYKNNPENKVSGLMHTELGGYTLDDIEVVAAFDVDFRKVGQDVSTAIFRGPNCTKVFYRDVPHLGVPVLMGSVMDGVAPHMSQSAERNAYNVNTSPSASEEKIIEALRKAKAEIVINYLPVGSQQAVELYARCALEARCAFINCMPVFISSNPDWANLFHERGLPLIGDDIKSQVGATIVHRALTTLFKRRGVKLNNTYQLNVGGNSDFLNMKDADRLSSKKISKTEAVQSVAASRLSSENIHIGPSDYVPWLKDNKVAFIRMEGELFGGVEMDIELRLSVEDSPNSAGVAIDMIRCAKLALDRGLSGALIEPSAYFCKHPPVQYDDDLAFQLIEKYIKCQEGVSALAGTPD